MLIHEPAQAKREPSVEARTRDRVLRVISEHAPATMAVLAEHVGVTDTAIRRHLDNLHEAGLIEVRDLATVSGRRGRGRPAKAYLLSAAGHQVLTADYDHLASSALRFLRDSVGGDAVRLFAEQRVGDLESRYAAELDGVGTDPAARVESLVESLSRDGFAASARPVGEPGSASPFTGIQLCQGHCPVQHAAAEFPEFCDAETDAFSRLLGVHVQRLATLAHGDHVCTTFVPTPATRHAPIAAASGIPASVASAPTKTAQTSTPPTSTPPTSTAPTTPASTTNERSLR